MVKELPILYNDGSKVLWLLDSGHGKETQGKRSPVWRDCTQLMEWKFNRKMSELIYIHARKANLDVRFLTQSDHDMPLPQRTDIADMIPTTKKKVVISNHANAASSMDASGIEVFTSVGQTESDRVAEFVLRRLFAKFPDAKRRTDETDGDLDKEAHFYILKNTVCPAVLIEYGFMTNEQECKKLMNPHWQETAARTVVEAMKDYENSI